MFTDIQEYYALTSHASRDNSKDSAMTDDDHKDKDFMVFSKLKVKVKQDDSLDDADCPQENDFDVFLMNTQQIKWIEDDEHEDDKVGHRY